MDLKRKRSDDEEETPSRSTSTTAKRKLEENLSDSDEQGDSPKRKLPSVSNHLAAELTVTKQAVENKLNFSATKRDPGSSFSAKLMKKMGYEEGRGLGKEGQGIVKPIEDSNQQGKRGLGFNVKNFEKRMEWDFSDDPVSAEETPKWLNNLGDEVPSLEDLLQWKKMGPKKRILDDEDKFCSPETLRQVLDCKSIFDNLDGRDMRSARSRANPYEAIGSRFFQNRAALKMANIDAVFGFIFTDPKHPDGRSKVEPNEPLYFCDVCAGPGGFSEYILWRKKWKSKGFGFTLKGDNDFKLSDFLAGAPEYFEPHYGVNGVNGDGDVTKSQNLKEFQKFVVASTNHTGVHFMMADGGFSVEGNENIQEILSKQLYLCQFLCALSVLRPGGNFVCKLFDLFTPFSVGLVYLMYLCFDRVCIHKPVTSRPANSERYIICEGARESKDIIYNYLFQVNDTLNETFGNDKSTQDVESIVPLSVLKKNKRFFEYIYDSNESIGKIQVFNLKKVQAFATNRSLFDYRQSQLIEDCLNYWKIPNQTRLIFADDEQLQEIDASNGGQGYRKRMRHTKVTPRPPNPRQLMMKFDDKIRASILNSDMSSLGMCRIAEIDPRMLEENFKKCSVYDYKCAMACGTLVLLFGCGGANVFELELTCSFNGGFRPGATEQNPVNKGWRKIDSMNIELPKETLLLAEKLNEYRGFDDKQIKSKALHVIDVFFIEGENLMDKNGRVTSIEERHQHLEILIKSISKNSRNDLNKVRVKDLSDVEKVKLDILDNLIERGGKFEQEYKHAIHIPLRFATEYYVYPTGLYFFKHVQSPWSVVRSKSTQMFYYYNRDLASSSYEIPNDRFFYSNPRYYLDHMMMWRWPKKAQSEDDSGLVGHLDQEEFLKLMTQYGCCFD